MADALGDLTEIPVCTVPAQDAEGDNSDQALPEVSMDDVHESPGSHAHIHGGEDGRDVELEADIEHARRSSEVVPEVEPESDSMPGASQCSRLLCVLDIADGGSVQTIPSLCARR